MDDFYQRVRKARERTLEVDGHRFVYLQPTELDLRECIGLDDRRLLNKLAGMFTGWDLRKCDLLKGEGADPAPFSAALFADWLADRTHLWPTFIDIIAKKMDEYRARQDDAGNG